MCVPGGIVIRKSLDENTLGLIFVYNAYDVHACMHAFASSLNKYNYRWWMQFVLLHPCFFLGVWIYHCILQKVSSSSSSAPDLTLLPIMARWLSPLSLSKRQAQLLLALGAPLILLRGCKFFFIGSLFESWKEILNSTSLRGVFLRMNVSKWVRWDLTLCSWCLVKCIDNLVYIVWITLSRTAEMTWPELQT